MHLPPIKPELAVDVPYEVFVKQLQSRQWSVAELADARLNLQQRIDLITAQLTSVDNLDRGTQWRTSTETARKYFLKKLAAVDQASQTEPAPKKPAGGHGFLVTFLIEGEHTVVATKRNPSELWAEMLAEEDAKEGAPPALVAFLNLTETAAKSLPESIWVDDL
jgi:hypothetical protein